MGCGYYIKVEKEILGHVKFRRMLKRFQEMQRHVTDVTRDVTRDETLLLGALTRLWIYADSRIDENNILRITIEEIDELVGIAGFADILPSDWLKVLDADHVQLPDFLEHNGTQARERFLANKRQRAYRERHREAKAGESVTQSNALRNAVTSPPDQPRPDQPRPNTKTKMVMSAAPTCEWLEEFKRAYPKRAGDPNWNGAARAGSARIREGHTAAQFIAGAERYAAWAAFTGKVGTEYVQMASTFLGPRKAFMLDWQKPTEPENPMDEILRVNRQGPSHERVFDAEPSTAVVGAPSGIVRR